MEIGLAIESEILFRKYFTFFVVICSTEIRGRFFKIILTFGKNRTIIKTKTKRFGFVRRNEGCH